jgi:UDP-N-acetylglucosamine 3-dehydrogenase
MANLHVDSYLALPGVEVAAVFGRTVGPVRELAGRANAVAAERFEDMLNDRSLDAIDICVPTPVHGPFVIAALEAGKHVFCETPLSLDVSAAVAMLDAARKNDRLLLVGLLMRSIALYQHFNQAFEGGALGRPIAASAYRLGSYLRAGAADYKPHYSEPTTELMTFDFDALNWIFGMPQGVSASASLMADGRPGHVFASLQYDGFVASVEASGLMPASFPFSTGLQIIGESASLELRNKFVEDGPPESALTRYPASGAAEVLDIDGHDPYEAECGYFLECIRGNADPALLDVERAIEALRISLATQESIRTKSYVAIGS